jgi:hypothetical protein
MRTLKLSELKQMRKQIISLIGAANSFSPNQKLHQKSVFSFKRFKLIETDKKIQMVYITGGGRTYKAGVLK